jgi:hypothetical protein
MEYLSELPAFWCKSETIVNVEARMRMILYFLLHVYKTKNLTIVLVGHANAFFTVLQKDLKNAESIEMSEEELRALLDV